MLSVQTFIFCCLLRFTCCSIAVDGCLLRNHQVVKSQSQLFSTKRYFLIHEIEQTDDLTPNCTCQDESPRCHFQLKPRRLGYTVQYVTNHLTNATSKPNQTNKLKRVSVVTHHDLSNETTIVRVVCNGRWIQDGQKCHHGKCSMVKSTRTVGKFPHKTTVVTLKAGNALFECQTRDNTFHQHLMTLHKAESKSKTQHLQIADEGNDPTPSDCENNTVECDKHKSFR